MLKYKRLFKYVIPAGLVYLYLANFLTQEKQKEVFVLVQSVGSKKWMFAQLPNKSDGTDGILLAERRKKSLWRVDEFIPKTQDFICKKHLLIIMGNQVHQMSIGEISFEKLGDLTTSLEKTSQIRMIMKIYTKTSGRYSS